MSSFDVKLSSVRASLYAGHWWHAHVEEDAKEDCKWHQFQYWWEEDGEAKKGWDEQRRETLVFNLNNVRCFTSRMSGGHDGEGRDVWDRADRGSTDPGTAKDAAYKVDDAEQDDV